MTPRDDGGLRPDFTDAVMRRLGLRRLSRAEARRRRRRRDLARLALTAAIATAGALAAAALIDRAGPTPATGPTIPAAVRHDLARHGAAVGGAVRNVRNLASRVGPPEALPQPAAGSDG